MRERLGELINRLGMRAFLKAVDLPAVAADDPGAACQPLLLLGSRGGEVMATRTDFGPPNYQEMLPPVIQKNYGQWKYHERVKPGVLKHVAESGDELYTVRVGSPRLVSTDWIRDVCDIADEFCDGLPALHQPPQPGVPGLGREQGRAADRITSKRTAIRSAAPAMPSATRSTPRAGSTATRRPPTPPASSRR